MLLFGQGAQVGVELAGDVALEAADDLLLRLAFGGASGDVGLGSGLVGHADERDAPEGVVGLAVPAAVESMTGEPGGGLDGAGAAERGEGGSLLIRSGLSPAVTRSVAATSVPTPWAASRAGVVAVTSWVEVGVEGVDLGAQFLLAAGEGSQGGLGGFDGVGGVRVGSVRIGLRVGPG